MNKKFWPPQILTHYPTLPSLTRASQSLPQAPVCHLLWSPQNSSLSHKQEHVFELGWRGGGWEDLCHKGISGSFALSWIFCHDLIAHSVPITPTPCRLPPTVPTPSMRYVICCGRHKTSICVTNKNMCLRLDWKAEAGRICVTKVHLALLLYPRILCL